MAVNLIEYQKQIFEHINDFQSKETEQLMLRFTAGGLNLILDAAHISNVSLMNTAPTIIPGADKHIIGLVQQEGSVLAVFDLGQIIHGDKTPILKNNRILMVDPKLAIGTAFLVEKTFSLLPKDSLTETQPMYTMDWIDGAYTTTETKDVWHNIDIKNLLADQAFVTKRQ